MSTIAISADSSKSGYINCGQSSLANVQNGTPLAVSPGSSILVGHQRANTGTSSYENREAFVTFDTSTVPANAVITGVTLRLTPVSSNMTSNRTYRLFDYISATGSLTAADYQTRAETQALTQLASWTQFDDSITNITLSPAPGSWINRSGFTYLVLVDAAFEDGATPASTTNFSTTYAWTSLAEGESNDPLLTITYDMPASGESWFLPTYDSYVQCESALSATVEAGLGTLTLQDASTPYLYAGVAYASSTFHAYETLLSFDTSSITAAPLSVTLQFKAADDYGMPADKTFDVYAYDFAAADSADFRNRSWVQSATSLGSFTIVQGQTRSTVEEVTLVTSSINQGGLTKLVIVSQDYKNGVWPAASGTTYSMADLNSKESPTAAGYPRLIVTAGAPPGSGNPIGSGTFQAIGTGTLQVRKNGQWVQL